MQSNYLIRLVLFIILGSSLAACDGNKGDGLRRAKYCKKSYENFNFTPTGSKKSSDLKKGEGLTLEVGNYVSNGVDIYYNNIARDIRMHIIARKSTDGQTSFDLLCAGGLGISRNMEPVTVSLPVVSKLIVSANGKTLIEPGNLLVDVRDRGASPWLQVNLTADTKSEEGDFKSIVSEETLDTLMLFQFTDTSFDVRQKLLAETASVIITNSSGYSKEVAKP